MEEMSMSEGDKEKNVDEEEEEKNMDEWDEEKKKKKSRWMWVEINMSEMNVDERDECRWKR